MKPNIIARLSFEFACAIIGLSRILNAQKEYVLSKQILRCGTSIGANVHEAGAGLTKREFIGKMSIAAKEARETQYWLQLFERMKVGGLDYSQFLRDINDIIKILTKIIITAQANLKAHQ